jgi:hypothetical protein
MSVDPSSKSRLGLRHKELFPSEQLFDRVAREVCEASCLPRKELFESWEVARRSRRLVRGGRIVDLAAGHGLVAMLMLLLDDTSPTAVCVDLRRPASSERLWNVMVARWPRLEGRLTYVEDRIETLPLEATDIIVSAHACGRLSDLVLDRAIAVNAAVAVLPCCQQLGQETATQLEGWMDQALAIDTMRAVRLQAAGYKVKTQRIPEAITPKNRLLLGVPR